jgi:O-antigen/teichoic acid export membrane protein
VYSSYTYYIFRGQYKKICPSILKVDFSLSGGLFSVGLKFFVIQVAGIIQFQTASIILIRYYGPLDVAGYSVVFKYFSVMPLLMGLILTPLWSAATDAFAKKDYTWITYAVKRYNVISLIVILVGFFMVCFFEPVMHFWIKDDAVINKISIQMVLLMYAFNVLSVYGSVYNTVLNGIGALDVQFYACLVSPFIFILMCVILISYFNLGVQAVIAASIIANFNAYILMPWQFRIYRREWKI